MVYKTRRSLADKLEAAFCAAAAKEGGKITIKRFSFKGLNPKEIAYSCKDGTFLSDGRYITRFWDPDKDSYHWYAVDNLPVSTLRCLVGGDHDVDTQKKRKDVYEDYEYQNYLKKVDTDDPNLVDPIDRKAYRNNYGNPEDIVIRKLCPEKKARLPRIDLSRLGKDPCIGFTESGRFDDETKRQIKAIARAFIMSLPKKKRDDCVWLFSSDLMQKEIAEMEGVSEAAISKRKKWYIDKLAAIFSEHGYPVANKNEKKQETEIRKSYAEHFEVASKALREIYCPEEEEEETA